MASMKTEFRLSKSKFVLKLRIRHLKCFGSIYSCAVLDFDKIVAILAYSSLTEIQNLQYILDLRHSW
jgi:hypothetical protein